MTEIALVGCAHIHTPGFIKEIGTRSDIRVKSVWDHDQARGRKRAEELGATFVADLAAVTGDGSIGSVVVCTETDRHEDVVVPIAEAGKNLFVEKPLGMRADDAYTMASAIEKAGVLFQTGYFQRGAPAHVFLRDEIRRGAFGKITRVRGSNCHNGALGRWFDTEWRWMTDPTVAGCGAYGDLGTHSLDILIWLIGDVSAATALLGEGTNAYPGCDETGEGILQFANGTIGTLAAAWDDLTDPVTLIVSGTEAHAAVIDGQLFYKSASMDGADGKKPWADLPARRSAGFPAYLDAISGKTDVELVGAREAAYRSSVMEALYVGAKNRAWVVPK